MNDVDLESCICEIRDLWPEWKPNGAQLRLWESKLRPSTQSITIAAIREEAAGQTRILKRPVMGRVLQWNADARQAQGLSADESRDREERRAQFEPALAYRLRCIDSTGGVNNVDTELSVWFGRRRNLDHVDRDVLSNEAEQRREQAGQLYGGTWIIEQHWAVDEVPF